MLFRSKKIRSGNRYVLDSNITVRRIKPKYLFGYELMEYDKFYIPVSDIEKTLIDFVYFKEPLDKIVLKEIGKKISIEKIKKYLKFYPKRIKKIVLKLLDLDENKK